MLIRTRGRPDILRARQGIRSVEEIRATPGDLVPAAVQCRPRSRANAASPGSRRSRRPRAAGRSTRSGHCSVGASRVSDPKCRNLFRRCGYSGRRPIMKTALVLRGWRRRDEVGGNGGEVPRRLGLRTVADPRPGSDPLRRGVWRTWRTNRSPQREGRKKAYPPCGG